MPYDKGIEKYAPAIFVILAIAIFTIILGFRAFLDRPLIIGDEPYFYLNLAESFAADAKLLENNFINPHQVIVGILALIAGKYTLTFLPLVLGIFSSLLLYRILSHFNLSFYERFASVIIFVLSPIFINTLLIADIFSTLVFLHLLAFYLVLKNKLATNILALLLYATISLFSIVHLFVSITILFFYSLHQKKYVFFYIAGILLIVITLTYYLPSYIFFPDLERFVFDASTFSAFVSDFGAVFGFTLFMLVLSVFGFFRIYDKKKIFFLFCLLAIAFLSFFYAELKAYANIEISVLSGIAVAYLFQRDYSLHTIRDFSTILIICGILFGSVSYTNRIIDFPPSQELYGILEKARDTLPQNAVVLSDVDNGFWISEIAKKHPVLDKNMKKNPAYQPLFNQTDAIFDSWDLERTKFMLNELNVTHILITKDMFDKVWDKPEQGLHFLLKNNETFKNVYQVNTSELWQFLAAD